MKDNSYRLQIVSRWRQQKKTCAEDDNVAKIKNEKKEGKEKIKEIQKITIK